MAGIQRVNRYSVASCRAKPDALFIFGDNLAGWGTAGQAAIRKEPNAIGIATKKAPRQFMSDGDIEEARASWVPVFERLQAHLSTGGDVIWPADGIGTGLADLRRKAPKVWDALCQNTREMFKLAGQSGELIIVACGGRDYANQGNVDAVLGLIHERHGLAEMVEGGARGADTLAGKWADAHDVLRRTEKANWGEYKKRAGWIRNQAMARLLADRRIQTGCKAAVVAFPGGVGTRMMISIAEEFRFKVIEAPTLVPEPSVASHVRRIGAQKHIVDDRPTRLQEPEEDQARLPLDP